VLPQDGQVVALAGGYDFRYSKFNRAIQSKRQPGSGFKPVVYSAALNEGMTPSTVVNDSPVRIGNWTLMNASRRYYGLTPLRTALTYSRNVVAVKLAQKIGIDKVVKLAMDMGFEASNCLASYHLPWAAVG
jgi:penicillin-binding protein 1A